MTVGKGVECKEHDVGCLGDNPGKEKERKVLLPLKKAEMVVLNLEERNVTKRRLREQRRGRKEEEGEVRKVEMVILVDLEKRNVTARGNEPNTDGNGKNCKELTKKIIEGWEESWYGIKLQLFVLVERTSDVSSLRKTTGGEGKRKNMKEMERVCLTREEYH